VGQNKFFGKDLFHDSNIIINVHHFYGDIWVSV